MSLVVDLKLMLSHKSVVMSAAETYAGTFLVMVGITLCVVGKTWRHTVQNGAAQ